MGIIKPIYIKPVDHFKEDFPDKGPTFLGGYPGNTPYNLDIQRCSLWVNGADYKQNSVQSEFNFGNGFTVAIWAQLWDNLGVGTSQVIAECIDSDTGNDGWRVEHIGDGAGADKIQASVVSSAPATTALQSNEINADAIPNIWRYIVLTKDGVDLILYVDGVSQDTSGAAVSVSGFQNRTLTIGATAAAGSLFNGLVHTLAVWDSVLTQDEIRTLFNHGHGGAFNLRKNQFNYGEADNLLSYYRLGLDANRSYSDFGSNGITLDGGAADEESIRAFAPSGVMASLQRHASPAAQGERYAYNTSDVVIGIEDEFTILTNFNLRPTALAKEYLLHLKNSGVANDEILIWKSVDTKLQVTLTDSSGAVMKTYQSSQSGWAGQFHTLFGFTWDGPNNELLLYKNGVVDLAPIKAPDNSGSMSNTERQVWLGAELGGGSSNYWGGDVYWAALWNRKLTPQEIWEIWNDGHFGLFDFQTDQGSYRASGNLVHWWVCGQPVVGSQEGSDIISDKFSVAEGGLDLSVGAQNIESLNDIVIVSGSVYNTSAATLSQFRSGNPGPALIVVDTHKIGSLVEQSIGISDTWTISLWALNSAHVGAGQIRPIVAAQSNVVPDANINRICLAQVAAGPFRFGGVKIWDNVGVLVKSYYGGLPIVNSLNQFYNMVATFDAASNSLKIYFNGEENVAGTPVDLDSSTLSFLDSDRFLHLGGPETAGGGEVNFSGIMGPVLIFDSILSDREIKQLYRSGHNFDPLRNRYGYASSASLKHWYRFTDATSMATLGNDYKGDLDLDDFTAGMTTMNNQQVMSLAAVARI